MPPGEPLNTGRIGREKEQRIKKRGILLASAGLALALSALLYFRVAGLSGVEWTVLAGLAAVTAAAQFILWLIPHAGWDRRLEWDDDYVLLPLLVAAVLLFSYAAAVPEARYLLLVGWFAALLLGLRFLGFWEVVGLGVLVTGLYAGALSLHLEDAARHGITWRVEGGHAAVLLAIHVFAGGVFQRVRRERRRKHELRRRLAEESVTDPLTGLRNRRFLERFLETELARARRYGSDCSLAMVDLDRFKRYNDTHGHPAGDEVLEAVAEILGSEARSSDVVARYGGEEFAVIMPDTGWESARVAAERMRRAVEATSFPGGEVVSGGLTVSLGVASYPDHAGSDEELIEAADRALYQAKERGRNQVVGPVAGTG